MVDLDKIRLKINDVDVTVGGVVPSDGSTTATKTGGWRSLRPVYDHGKCVSCGSCWAVCPEGCIKKGKDDKFDADLDFCKGCGICANVCPVKCIKMEMEKK